MIVGYDRQQARLGIIIGVTLSLMRYLRWLDIYPLTSHQFTQTGKENKTLSAPVYVIS